MKVLLAIDLIKDFGPGGALPVPEAEKVVPLTNQLLADPAFDWRINVCEKHTPGHISFASRYPGLKPFDKRVVDGQEFTVWPDHSVDGTWGAEPLADLRVDLFDRTVVKGGTVDVHSYSGFIDDTRTVHTELEALLLSAAQSRGESRADIELYVCGLATDYCAGLTALDGAMLGFKTSLILDASRAIAADTELAMLRKLADAGVAVVESREVLQANLREREVERSTGQELRP